MPCDPRRLPKITGTRVDAWLWRYYGCPRRATRGGIGRLGCGPVAVRGGAALLVVGVDLVLDACPSATSLLRRLLSRTGLGSLHLLVTGARRCAGALYGSQDDFIFDLIILYVL